MTQYLMAVHGPAEVDDPYGGYGTKEAMEQAFADTEAFNEQLRTDGYWVFAGGLEPIESAATVDNTGATAVVTDGPFAEAKEWLGGFWVIEAPDRDAALALAKEASAACAGQVEVRPFQGA
jgi:hypothetical protein